MSKKFGQTVEEYFRNKMRLLKQTHLTHLEQVQLLTDGLPAHWRPHMSTAGAATPTDWIGFSLKLESDFKVVEQKFKPKGNQHFNKKKAFVNMAGTSKQTQSSKPLPQTPCHFCKALNMEEYHWHSVCPNRTNVLTRAKARSDQTNTTTSNHTQPQEQKTHSQDSHTLSDHSRVAELINVDVKINGQQITGFVDSGSKITILGEQESKALHLKMIPNTSIAVQTLSGIIHTVGQTDVNLTIGQITQTVRLHVLSNFKYQLLIGLDVGKPFGLTVHFGSSAVSVRDPQQSFDCLTTTTLNSSIREIVDNFSDVFAQNEADIGRITAVKHQIITKPHAPIQLRYYRRPQSEYDKINATVKDLEQKGLIRKSNSP